MTVYSYGFEHHSNLHPSHIFLSPWISNSHPRVSMSKQGLNSVHPNLIPFILANLNPHHLSKHMRSTQLLRITASTFPFSCSETSHEVCKQCLQTPSVSFTQSSLTTSFQNPGLKSQRPYQEPAKLSEICRGLAPSHMITPLHYYLPPLLLLLLYIPQHVKFTLYLRASELGSLPGIVSL